jgi:calmodulin-regulated spectrin-associated protein
VHRGRGVPTLSSVVQAEEPLLPARLRPAKEKQNQDSKAEERGEPIAAGRPSNWEDSRRSSYAGRRSRRNSLSEDSQVSFVVNRCMWTVILRSLYRIPYNITN